MVAKCPALHAVHDQVCPSPAQLPGSPSHWTVDSLRGSLQLPASAREAALATLKSVAANCLSVCLPAACGALPPPPSDRWAAGRRRPDEAQRLALHALGSLSARSAACGEPQEAPQVQHPQQMDRQPGKWLERQAGVGGCGV
jgi:hypothetical protein